MTANEIYEMLLEGVTRLDPTSDGIISGDGEREVRRIVTCHKLTFDMLDRAKAAGADMIITHEPPFVDGNAPGSHIPVDVEKARRIAGSGIAVCRFHDHAHADEFDYIHEGFRTNADQTTMFLKEQSKFENRYTGEVLIDSESVNIVMNGSKYSRFAANYVQFGNYQLRRTSDGGLAFKITDI